MGAEAWAKGRMPYRVPASGSGAGRPARDRGRFAMTSAEARVLVVVLLAVLVFVLMAKGTLSLAAQARMRTRILSTNSAPQQCATRKREACPAHAYRLCMSHGAAYVPP